MKTSCLILLISFSIGFAQAQFVEDFSSGNVLNTAIWQGSTAFFKINTAKKGGAKLASPMNKSRI